MTGKSESSTKRRLGLAVAAAIVAAAAPICGAYADGHDRDRHYHRGWHAYGGWYYAPGYYPAPGVVYAAPPPVYVAPPPVVVYPAPVAPSLNVVVPLHFH